MNIKNLKHYIIVIAILFGISPFVTSIYANINLFQMTSLVPNNDDEEDEEEMRMRMRTKKRKMMKKRMRTRTRKKRKMMKKLQ